MADYLQLLKRAKEHLPEVETKTGRFEVPKVKGHVEGNKTIIVNVFSILDAIAREPDHLLKFLQRELATPAHFEEKRLVFGRKLSSALINEKVKQYVDQYVLCSECQKPDTKLLDEEEKVVKRCMACGHKVVV